MIFKLNSTTGRQGHPSVPDKAFLAIIIKVDHLDLPGVAFQDHTDTPIYQ